MQTVISNLILNEKQKQHHFKIQISLIGMRTEYIISISVGFQPEIDHTHLHVKTVNATLKGNSETVEMIHGCTVCLCISVNVNTDNIWS